jgi:cytoskeletal protein RodZ
MSQRPENFKADEEPDETLVTPRFDDAAARRAHPVVPLAEAPAHTRRARAPRRSWAPALLAVMLLVAAALGGAVATKFMQGPRAESAQEAEQAPQEQTQTAPAQKAEAPPTQSSTPATAEAEPRADASAKPASRDTQTRPARTNVPAPVAVVPAREDAYEDEDEDRRGRGSGRRRGREDHEDDVEKELRKAMKRGKGKAPRLVDVITSSP